MRSLILIDEVKAHATLFIDLVVTAISLMITAYIVPGFIVNSFVAALIAAVLGLLMP